jgi:hypothetical protein
MDLGTVRGWQTMVVQFLGRKLCIDKAGRTGEFYDQEMNLKYANLMNIFTINVGDAAERLCRNVYSHFVHLR